MGGTAVEPGTLSAEHVAQLATAADSLASANRQIQEVGAVLDGYMSREDGWILSGFIRDVLGEIGDIAGSVLGISEKVHGSLTSTERGIFEAFERGAEG